MLAEFATRLAIALPLICLAAALTLLAIRRGWLGWPSLAARPRATQADTQAFSITALKSLSPAARLAVVRFQGRELLLGISGPTITVLAGADTASAPRPSGPRAKDLSPLEPEPGP